MSNTTVGSTLAWMRARGMVTDVQPETPRATPGPPNGPKYVRLTDDGRWHFERRRERLFLTEFESVSPAPLLPVHGPAAPRSGTTPRRRLRAAGGGV